MTDLTALTANIDTVATGLGFGLVRVAMIGGTSDPTLQIMAERPDTRQLTIDDCAELSRGISELIDRMEADGRDPIDGTYRLEVSSPGIDRPLTRRADFSDWAGHEARLKLDPPVDGAKQVSGDLVGIEASDHGDIVRIASPKGVRAIPYANIASAKLLLTDKLIHATAPLSSEGADIIKTEG